MTNYSCDMPTPKMIQPVSNCTLVLRVQAEYSVAAQATTLRCRLETPATGEHRGFSDLHALLAAIETDLLAMQQLLVTEYEQQL